MSRVYVAGKTDNIPRVRVVQAMMQAWGWTITHDWTRTVEKVGGSAEEHKVPPEKQAEYALADMMGVEAAHRVVVVGSPGLCGTLIEFGLALGYGTPVWTLGKFERVSVFFHLPKVTHCEDEQALWVELAKYGPTGRLFEPPVYGTTMQRILGGEES